MYILILVTNSPPCVSALTTEVLTARYRLHRKVAGHTEAFLWLLDTQYTVDENVVHPLDLPETMVVQMTTDGTLVISSSTIKRLSYYESTMYHNSCKEWIADVAQFSMLNPEKCRRMVCYLV